MTTKIAEDEFVGPWFDQLTADTQEKLRAGYAEFLKSGSHEADYGFTYYYNSVAPASLFPGEVKPSKDDLLSGAYDPQTFRKLGDAQDSTSIPQKSSEAPSAPPADRKTEPSRFVPTAAGYSLLYSNTPTVKRIPRDAMIFINHDYNLPLVSGDIENSLLQTAVSTVSVGLGTKNSPGSCNFTIEIPRHKIREYFNKYRFMLTPMMEVEVYFKGCFTIQDDAGNEGIPYYKAFWGIISNVDFSYSSGVHRLSVQCLDILRILQIMKYMQNLASVGVFGEGFYHLNRNSLPHPMESPSAYAGALMKMTPYQAILTLMRFGFQNVVLPETWLQAGINSQGAPGTVKQSMDLKGSTAFAAFDKSGLKSNAGLAYDFNDIIGYWQHRFGAIQGKLRMYGLAEASEPTMYSTVDKGKTTSEILARYASFKTWALDAEIINNTLPLVANMLETNIGLSGDGTSVLDIIKRIVDSIGWEFFMNTDGDIDCKPPFYNMEVRNNPIHVITAEELIGFNFGENEGNICNVLTVTGDWTAYSSTNRAAVPLGFHMNFPSVKKFCIRHQEISRPWAQSYDLCRILAVAEMDLQNCASMSFSLTIKGRPELKIGYPVYIKPFDFYAYVTQKQSSFTFGGSYDDTLTLTACRFPYMGKLEEKKNIVMVGDAPVDPPTKAQEAIRKDNRIIFDDSTTFHEEVFTGKDKPLFATTNMYPVSDEAGYELYGGLPYGRQYEVSYDNQIVIKPEFDYLTFQGGSAQARQKEQIMALSTNGHKSQNQVSVENIQGKWDPRSDSAGVIHDKEDLSVRRRVSTIGNTSSAAPINPASLNDKDRATNETKTSGFSSMLNKAPRK